jgi:transposase
MPRQYPQQFRERALRMVEESLPEHETEFAAMKKVATKLGISPEAIRRWKRQSEVDSGLRPGLSSQEHDEVRRLRRENAELRRANEILKSASAFFAAELDRPTTK